MLYVRKKAHKTSPLNGQRQLPLVLGADIRVPGVDYFHLARNKPL